VVASRRGRVRILRDFLRQGGARHAARGCKKHRSQRRGTLNRARDDVVYDYDAFGNLIEEHANDTNPFRYCGEYFDLCSKRYYLRSRYYDPSTGRFTQRDAFLGFYTDPLSLNRYTYCHNNPIKYIDPSGYVVTQWDLDNCSPAQIAQIKAATDAWNVAKAANDSAAMDAAHATANAARAGNLSSGQTIGSQGYVSNSNGSSAKGGSTNVYLDTNDTYKLITKTSLQGKALDSNTAVWQAESNIVSALSAYQGGYITYEHLERNITLNYDNLVSAIKSSSDIIGTSAMPAIDTLPATNTLQGSAHLGSYALLSASSIAASFPVSSVSSLAAALPWLAGGIATGLASIKTAIATSWLPAVAIAAAVVAVAAIAIVVHQAVTYLADAEKTKEWVNAHIETGGIRGQQRDHSVYVIYENSDSKVWYVGMTNDFNRRKNEHQTGSDPKYPEATFTMIQVANGFTRNEARALEQCLITAYTIDALKNKINSIAEGRWGEFQSEFARTTSLLSGFVT